jgi:hypothetical protein
MPERIINNRRSYSSLWIALLVGLVNGLLFVVLIPPWQHYDEPNHFEYAWLMAKRGGIPATDDYSRSMRLAVAESMVQNEFFRGMNYTPDLNPKAGPVWIGPISQLNNPPLYYAVASLPLRFLRGQKIELQLMVGRLVSFLLYLVTILAAWGVVAEITPSGHLLRLLVPVTIAFLPGFTDSMTAMNNDSAAVALVSLCLWGCVRMVRQGISVANLLWSMSTAILTLLAKETAFMAIPLFLAAFVLAIFRRSYRWLAWVILGVGIIGAGLLVFSWGDSAGWYRSTSQKSFTRVANPQAVDGKYVFQLDARAADTPAWIPSLFQPVLVIHPKENSKVSFTLGSWMWADRQTRARMPILGDGYNIHTKYVDIGVEPSFYSYTVTVPTDKGLRLWVSLDPAPDDPETTIYYDGLVLVQGLIPANEPPEYDPAESESGIWGGIPITNLLRNPSAERAGLRVAPWLDDLGARFLPDHTRPSALVSYALDWQGAGWQYLMTIDRLLRTFWAQFGWGHVELLGYKPYRLFVLLSLLGIFGAGTWFVRRLLRKQQFPWDIIALFAILMVGTWAGTVSRGAIYLGVTRLYLPVARYAYPAIIPTVTLLSIGWLELLTLPNRLPSWRKYHPQFTIATWFLILVMIDLYSVVSILAYYRR